MNSCAVEEPLSIEELADIQRAEADGAVASAEIARYAAEVGRPVSWEEENATSTQSFAPSPSANQLYPVPTGVPSYNNKTYTPAATTSSASSAGATGRVLLTAGKKYDGPTEEEQALAAQKQRIWEENYRAKQEQLKSGQYNYDSYKGTRAGPERTDYGPGSGKGLAR